MKLGRADVRSALPQISCVRNILYDNKLFWKKLSNGFQIKSDKLLRLPSESDMMCYRYMREFSEKKNVNASGRLSNGDFMGIPFSTYPT